MEDFPHNRPGAALVKPYCFIAVCLFTLYVLMLTLASRAYPPAPLCHASTVDPLSPAPPPALSGA